MKHLTLKQELLLRHVAEQDGPCQLGGDWKRTAETLVERGDLVRCEGGYDLPHRAKGREEKR